MTEDYLKNYRILGIQPGTSWKQLRQAYKKMVNAWHPDRFQQDARQKKLAEEKTKEITQSYKELAEYYKKFGVLPLPVEEEASPATDERTAHAAPAESPAPEVENPEPAPTESAAGVSSPWASKRRTRVIISLALLGSAYLVSQVAPREHQDNAPLNEQYADQTVNTGRDDEGTDAAPAEQHFTIGSSLGEVYAIQGVPTRTEQDIWYYGDSKVYFAEGKVLRWDESQGNPLRVSIVPRTEETNTSFFGHGSTKEEVLAAQGIPDRDAGSVWDYGLSRVYFEKDRVTHWYESQLDPLRVRR
jgi:curved DNA-binding protein CbpA